MGIDLVVVGLSLQAQENAEDAQYAAAQEQKKVQNEQRASNAAQAAAERRKQIREERVKRARVMASSQASGTSGSSGEFGAIGSLETTLSSNIGQNLGALQTASNISIFNQAAADFMTEANVFQNEASMWNQVGAFISQSQSSAMKAGGA